VAVSTGKDVMHWQEHPGFGMQRSLLALAALSWIGAGTVPAATLADLGFPDGVTLRGPRPSLEVFFPLPREATGATLVMQLTASPALDALSSVTIEAGGVTVATFAARTLAAAPQRIPVPDRLLAEDFLRVAVLADQALDRSDPCADNSGPAVWSRVEPGTSLELVAPAGRAGVGEAWRRLAGTVRIAVAETAGTAEIEAALALAVALWTRGARPEVTTQQTGADIVIGAQPDALSAPTQGPALRIADAAAARALIAMPGLVRAPTSVTGARGNAQGVAAGSGAEMAFGTLGIRAAPVAFAGNGRITFDLPFDRLPAGRVPTAVTLFLGGSALPANETVLVTLLAGQRLIGSTTMRGRIGLDGWQVALPEDVVRHRMRFELVMQRVSQQRACAGDGTLLAELQPGSWVRLADGVPRADRIENVSISSDRPALLRIDGPPSAAVPALALAARLLADAGARPTALTVAGDAAPLDRTFVIIGTAPPNGIQDPPVRPDRGRIVITDTANGQQTELTLGEGPTTVQLVRSANANGLWLSPGAPETMRNVGGLSGGTLAVLDGVGSPLVVDTSLPRFVVQQPGASDLAALLARWRTELFILAWIVLTLVAVLIVVRIRRARA
jgi:hypothetical protein